MLPAEAGLTLANINTQIPNPTLRECRGNDLGRLHAAL
jgi:hypothetical protein